ncbi:MAG: argininosuccinate lyase [Bacteroidetes bacterium]|nr:argininosuccinate lyase [Bacteroidota bacterium]
METKLWEKSTGLNKNIEDFTIGNDRELDLQLAESDVLGSIAHINMLASIGLLAKEELIFLKAGLLEILSEIKKGNFIIEPGVEDVHSQVEIMLTRSCGEAGKKIHSGRSRNDQVLVDLKLFMRHQLTSLVKDVEKLFYQLINLSETHQHKLLPGYTHLQVAMPSSFGLWFGAYAESLIDDLQLVLAAYKITNKNPLGSAAGYGSSFPLNRGMTTKLLGFDNLNFNVVYAQMGRGKTEKAVAMALASVASTLGKFSMDVCLYLSQNFGFISFPDDLTTGSSIMPHKKNPDVFELIRGRCNKIQALPNEISLLTNNLPSGYHRDFQLLKESLFPAFKSLADAIKITRFMLGHIQLKDGILKDEKYKYAFSVERVNEEVLNGVPFRDAYKKISFEIDNGIFKPNLNIKHTHEGSIGNLCNMEITTMMQEILNDFNFKITAEALENLVK